MYKKKKLMAEWRSLVGPTECISSRQRVSDRQLTTSCEDLLGILCFHSSASIWERTSLGLVLTEAWHGGSVWRLNYRGALRPMMAIGWVLGRLSHLRILLMLRLVSWLRSWIAASIQLCRLLMPSTGLISSLRYRAILITSPSEPTDIRPRSIMAWAARMGVFVIGLKMCSHRLANESLGNWGW